MPPKKELQPVTAMVPVEPQLPHLQEHRNPFAPSNYKEAWDFANVIARAGLCRKEFIGQPERCFIAIQAGAEVGLAPMQSMSAFAVINNIASIYGDAMLAVVMASRPYERHSEWIEHEDTDKMIAHCMVKRRGQEEYTVKYSVQDAKIAKLWGKKTWDNKDSPWITNPKRMLQMRARAFALRDKFPDVLRGLQMAEEVQDYIVDVPRPKPGPDKPKKQEPKPEEEKPQVTETPAEPTNGDIPAKDSGAGRREDSLYAHGIVNGLEGGTTKKGTKWCRLSLDVGYETISIFNYHASLMEACTTSVHRHIHLFTHKQQKASKAFGESGDMIYVLDDIRSIDDMAYQKGQPVGKLGPDMEYPEVDESPQES